MSIELATALYNNIGCIKHLRTFEFLKAIQENKDADQWSRITYAKWRDQYGIHAFILNECTRECQELGFIEIGRENKEGLAIDGGKGTKRIYKLTLDKVGAKTPEIEPKKVDVEPENKPEPIVPEKVETKRNAMQATKFSKDKKVSAEKSKTEKMAPAKKTIANLVKKQTLKPKKNEPKKQVKKITKKK